MEKLSENFEKYISMTLLLLSGVFVIFQTVELLWMTGERMYTRATTALGLDPTPEYSRQIMIVFFNILLMLEIIDSFILCNIVKPGGGIGWNLSFDAPRFCCRKKCFAYDVFGDFDAIESKTFTEYRNNFPVLGSEQVRY